MSRLLGLVGGIGDREPRLRNQFQLQAYYILSLTLRRLSLQKGRKTIHQVACPQQPGSGVVTGGRPEQKCPWPRFWIQWSVGTMWG